MFDAAKNLKLIVRAGAGVDNIDLTYDPKVEKENALTRLECQNPQVDKSRFIFTNSAQEQLMELMRLLCSPIGISSRRIHITSSMTR